MSLHRDNRENGEDLQEKRQLIGTAWYRCTIGRS